MPEEIRGEEAQMVVPWCSLHSQDGRRLSFESVCQLESVSVFSKLKKKFHQLK